MFAGFERLHASWSVEEKRRHAGRHAFAGVLIETIADADRPAAASDGIRCETDGGFHEAACAQHTVAWREHGNANAERQHEITQLEHKDARVQHATADAQDADHFAHGAFAAITVCW